MRLDNYLVEHGFFESRNRAQEAIKSALVRVDGKVVTKPSFKIDSNRVEVKEQKFYVSRAAKKLEEYLKENPIDFKGKDLLDVGSSTGGFTQIVLEQGAKSVACVDVGKEQLHKSLRSSSKVKVYEECDIREFKSEPFDIVVSDVSFISLTKIIDSINTLTKESSQILLLFKPQFEVGKNAKRDSKGVVTNKLAIQEAQEQFLAKTKELNWQLLDTRESRVSGKEGNVEIFYLFEKKS